MVLLALTTTYDLEVEQLDFQNNISSWRFEGVYIYGETKRLCGRSKYLGM